MCLKPDIHDGLGRECMKRQCTFIGMSIEHMGKTVTSVYSAPQLFQSGGINERQWYMKSIKPCNYVGHFRTGNDYLHDLDKQWLIKRDYTGITMVLGCPTLSEEQCRIYRTEFCGVQIDEWKDY